MFTQVNSGSAEKCSLGGEGSVRMFTQVRSGSAEICSLGGEGSVRMFTQVKVGQCREVFTRRGGQCRTCNQGMEGESVFTLRVG